MKLCTIYPVSSLRIAPNQLRNDKTTKNHVIIEIFERLRIFLVGFGGLSFMAMSYLVLKLRNLTKNPENKKTPV